MQDKATESEDYQKDGTKHVNEKYKLETCTSVRKKSGRTKCASFSIPNEHHLANTKAMQTWSDRSERVLETKQLRQLHSRTPLQPGEVMLLPDTVKLGVRRNVRNGIRLQI